MRSSSPTVFEPSHVDFSRVGGEPVLHAQHFADSRDAMQVKRIVAGIVVAAISRTDTFIAALGGQGEGLAAQVGVQAEGEGRNSGSAGRSPGRSSSPGDNEFRSQQVRIGHLPRSAWL